MINQHELSLSCKASLRRVVRLGATASAIRRQESLADLRMRLQ
jgi:hypothetical protein